MARPGQRVQDAGPQLKPIALGAAILTTRCTSLALTLALCTSAAHAQGAPSDTVVHGVPSWAARTLRQSLTKFGLVLTTHVSPSSLEGDFDGDGLPDLAVQVQQRANHKRGILIVHRGNLSVHVLGAGNAFGNGGDDFGWMGQWSVRDRPALTEVRARGRHVLYVSKPESAGGIIWWDGRRYQWTQWGD